MIFFSSLDHDNHIKSKLKSITKLNFNKLNVEG
jgi:hypothetical protein